MVEDEEICSVCGDPEYDNDGYETHADEEEYGHDFEPKKDDSLTLQDVKEGLDVLDKGIGIWNKITKSELSANRFKIPPPMDKVPDLEIAEHPDAKAEKRHKEIMKWTKIGFIVATALTITAIVFN